MKRLTKLPFCLLVAPLFSLAPAAQEMPTETDVRGLIVREDAAFDGYTLFSMLAGKSVLLLGMDGEVVHRWDLPTMTESAILLDSGILLRWGLSREDWSMEVDENSTQRFQGPGVAGGLIEEVDWEGNSLWRFVLDDDYQLLHHDIALLPNGNVLFLAWEHRYTEDSIEAGRDPAQVNERGMWPDAVYEIKPTRPEGAEIVWEWHVWDHLVQDFDETKQNFGTVAGNYGRIDINADHRGRPPLTPEEIEEREELARQMAALGYGGEDEEDEEDDSDDAPRSGTVPDWLHTNAIDYLPEHDLIVMSSPSLNEVYVIDHSTTVEEAASSSGGRFGKGGDLLWRWGNPRNWGAGDESDQQLSFQHDSTWLPSSGELRLLVFNNGRVRSGDPYSSADELVLPFDPEKGFVREAGQRFGPEGPVWTHSETGFYSSFISGAQRLPNGNTLVCSGAQGRVFEVTPDNRVVWDFRNPHTGESLEGIPANSIYRASRIAKDHPGLAGKSL